MIIQSNNKIQSPFPRPMAHRAVPISVSIALGHASANAVKATTWGWSTGSSASLNFPLHSHMSSARREGSEYHYKSLWYDSARARTHDLPVVRQTLYNWAITPYYSVLQRLKMKYKRSVRMWTNCLPALCKANLCIVEMYDNFEYRLFSVVIATTF